MSPACRRSAACTIACELLAEFDDLKIEAASTLASGTMPWWLIGAAFVSTSVSSEQIVGTVGAAYKGGMAIANWEWWCLPTYVLLLIFFIPLYLRNRIMTVPELLNRRFGEGPRGQRYLRVIGRMRLRDGSPGSLPGRKLCSSKGALRSPSARRSSRPY